MSDEIRPCSDGKCSMDCPKFYYDTMPGWPSAQACYMWDESIDGKEPYYLTNEICKPAQRVNQQPAPGGSGQPIQ